MDWKNPNYLPIFQERIANIRKLEEASPVEIERLFAYYATAPWEFINDWGMTFDPRNPERGLPSMVPFKLFPRQVEFCQWIYEKWQRQQPGLSDKSRDVGATWLAGATAASMCLFRTGLAIGFGSRKEDYVGKIGTFKPIFPKIRMFLENLPALFLRGWDVTRHAPYMRITFPATGSIIMGEAGDQIGRGDRASIYFVDEAAYIERAELVENSLSQTTNCRIDLSSVNGMNNMFAKKRHGGKVDVFTFHWKQDPRKDDDWYASLSMGPEEITPGGRRGRGLEPVTIAQEVDLDYSASVTGIVIPSAWVRAAIDAYDKLDLEPAGEKRLALDVADEGVDKNAAIGTTGNQIDYIEEWSGKGADIFNTVNRAFAICDDKHYKGFRYDADGLGAGVRGDARVINQQRREAGAPTYIVEGFRSSDKVVDPDGIVQGTIGGEGDKGRLNKDYFYNRKAQGWWTLREMFRKTHRWIVDGYPCDIDDVISISSKAKGYEKLVSEFSQPTYDRNPAGKMLIQKKPDGMKSPNLADAAMIRFARNDGVPLNITPEVLHELQVAGQMMLRQGRGRRRYR